MQAMTSDDRSKIEAWAETHAPRARLTLVKNDDPRAQALDAFVTDLSETVPGLSVVRDTAGDGPAPGLYVGTNILYQAIAEQQELAPFLKALDGDVSALSSKAAEILDTVRMPALFKIYVTPMCPFCPQVVEPFLAAATVNTHVHVRIIDGTLFDELAEADRVSAAPTVIAEGGFRWTGQVDLAEVLDVVAHQDPALLGADSLKALLAQGGAEELADLMADSGKVFPAFVDLLAHPRWSVRLGAMVAFEYLVEKNRLLAGQVADPLWERLTAGSDEAAGDMVSIIGQSGRADYADRLRHLAETTDNPELAEAAREAIDALAAGMS